jgi:hypothetical protein
MLLGLCYHTNNGDDPFYYKMGSDGIPEVGSMIDAITLEPLVFHASNPLRNTGITWANDKGQKAHTALWNEFGAGIKTPRGRR